MTQKAPELLIFHDLLAEMDAFFGIAIGSTFPGEEADKFNAIIQEVKDWQPEEATPDTLPDGLLAAIFAAYGLQAKAMLHRCGDGSKAELDAANDAYWAAQDCLRKAVVTLQRFVEITAGMTRSEAAASRPAQALH